MYVPVHPVKTSSAKWNNWTLKYPRGAAIPCSNTTRISKKEDGLNQDVNQTHLQALGILLIRERWRDSKKEIFPLSVLPLSTYRMEVKSDKWIRWHSDDRLAWRCDKGVFRKMEHYQIKPDATKLAQNQLEVAKTSSVLVTHENVPLELVHRD